MTTPDAARVAVARRWFRQIGHKAVERDGVTAVATLAHPDTWDAHFVFASPLAGPEAVMATLARGFAHSRWPVALTRTWVRSATSAGG